MNEDRAKAAWLNTREEEDAFSDILESRHFVVFPWLVSSILRLTPHSVMDYGGGDGKFLAALRRQFAASCGITILLRRWSRMRSTFWAMPMYGSAKTRTRSLREASMSWCRWPSG